MKQTGQTKGNNYYRGKQNQHSLRIVPTNSTLAITWFEHISIVICLNATPKLRHNSTVNIAIERLMKQTEKREIMTFLTDNSQAL
jgi:hypothetical protein